jgi:hypothetical protein
MKLAAFMLAVVAAPTPAAAEGTQTLVDCGFRSIDFADLSPTGESRRLLILFEHGAGRREAIDVGSLRVFDPTNLLGGLPMNSAEYRNGGRMLTMEAGSGRASFFRFAIAPSPRVPGRWWGGLALNGEASREEAMAQSYMGECTVQTPPDAAARFDELRNEQ